MTEEIDLKIQCCYCGNYVRPEYEINQHIGEIRIKGGLKDWIDGDRFKCPHCVEDENKTYGPLKVKKVEK